MRFEPKTEEELNSFLLLPAGDYDAEVIRAEEKVSKNSGNEMIELQLKVYGDGDETTLVRDYLVGTEKAAYKIRHFCDSAGMIDVYDRGELDETVCVGKSVRVKLVVDDHPDFGAQNKIKDYVTQEQAKQSKLKSAGVKVTVRKHQPIEEDDIPF